MELIYIRQTELLLRVLPYIHEPGVFALHGGTAINLFQRSTFSLLKIKFEFPEK
jgi:hypothetical protein